MGCKATQGDLEKTARSKERKSSKTAGRLSLHLFIAPCDALDLNRLSFYFLRVCRVVCLFILFHFFFSLSPSLCLSLNSLDSDNAGIDGLWMDRRGRTRCSALV